MVPFERESLADDKEQDKSQQTDGSPAQFKALDDGKEQDTVQLHEKFPFRRASAVVVLALALIGLAVLAGYMVVAELNQRSSEDAALVNSAGRQRMLAQRIARLAFSLQASSLDGRQKVQQELRITLQRWRNGHDAFLRKEALERISSETHPSAQRVDAIETAFTDIETITEQVLALSPEQSLPLSDLEATCDRYVDEVETLLGELQKESEANIREVALALKGIVLGATILLSAEGWFLFRPMLLSLKASYGVLDDAHRKVERALQARIEAERERDVLRGLLPMCAGCKKVRDEAGLWQHIEKYIEDRSEARFSHGLCLDCIRRLYPSYAERIVDKLASDEEAIELPTESNYRRTL